MVCNNVLKIVNVQIQHISFRIIQYLRDDVHLPSSSLPVIAYADILSHVCEASSVDDSGQPTFAVFCRPCARSLRQFVHKAKTKILRIFMCINTLQISDGYMQNISYLEVQNVNDCVRLPSSHVQVTAHVDTVAQVVTSTSFGGC